MPAQPLQAGAVNKGGGGGGRGGPSGGTLGVGGSGVIIVTYPTANKPADALGGTISTVGSETLHTFTSSGTFTLG
jgi:hypothetical protein